MTLGVDKVMGVVGKCLGVCVCVCEFVAAVVRVGEGSEVAGPNLHAVRLLCGAVRAPGGREGGGPSRA